MNVTGARGRRAAAPRGRGLMIAITLLIIGLGGGTASAATWHADHTVTVDTPVEDTLVATGSMITVSAPVAGSALLVGSHIQVDGAISNTLAAMGGLIDVGGPVAGDAILMGGTVTVDQGAAISGDTTLYAGSAVIDGTLSGNLAVKSGAVTVGGTVMGNVDASSGHLTLRPGAHIMGNVRFSGPQALELPAGAMIDGTVEYTGALPHRHHGGDWWPKAAPEGLSSSWAWSWSHPLHGFGPLGKGIGVFLIGVVLYLLFPGLVRGTASRIADAPAWSTVLGLIALILAPVAMILACLTLIGIPLALVALLVYLATLAVAFPLALFGLSDWAASRRRGPPASPGVRIRRYAVTVIIVTLLTWIPAVDDVAGPLILLMGFGGLVGQLTRRAPAASTGY